MAVEKELRAGLWLGLTAEDICRKAMQVGARGTSRASLCPSHDPVGRHVSTRTLL